MQSKCPNCGAQIEHDDFLFEVACDQCKMRFNPFMSMSEPPPIDGVEAGGGPTSMTPSETPAPAAGFAESNAVFQELRDFGEAVARGEAPPPSAPKPASKAAPKPPSTAAPAAGMPGAVMAGGECLMTGGESLQGYQIEAYLAPLSAWTDLDSGSDNPMKPAFDALWERAQLAGGNGVVDLRWSLSADSLKVLVSGTAVRCHKM